MQLKFSSPQKLAAAIKRKVEGHAQIIDTFASALWYNQYRFKLANASPAIRSMIPPKTNFLLQGPSGSGKTHLVKTAVELMEVPYVYASINSFSAAGYVGKSIGDLMNDLVRTADTIELANRGIIFLDEADKLAQKKHVTVDIKGRALQQELLTYMEDNSEVLIRGGQIPSTRDVTFIAAGAFVGLPEKPSLSVADLIDYGFIPEFIARFSVKLKMAQLSDKELRSLLVNRALKELQNFFMYHQIKLNFDESAIDALLVKSKVNNLGGREIRSVVSATMNQLLKYLPNRSARPIREIRVDSETVLYGMDPTLKHGRWKPSDSQEVDASQRQPKNPNLPNFDESFGDPVLESTNWTQERFLAQGTPDSRIWWNKLIENMPSDRLQKLLSDLERYQIELDRFRRVVKRHHGNVESAMTQLMLF
jgi:ATP-dependent Clp protease ATP-binding subunit ClpX